MDREETSAATQEYIESLDRDLVDFVAAQLVERNLTDRDALAQRLQGAIDKAFGDVVASRTVELRTLLENASAGLNTADQNLSAKIGALEAAIAAIPNRVPAAGSAPADDANDGKTLLIMPKGQNDTQPSELGDSTVGAESSRSGIEKSMAGSLLKSGSDVPKAEDDTDSASKSETDAEGEGGGFLNGVSLSTWRGIAIVASLLVIGLGTYAIMQFTNGLAQASTIEQLETSIAQVQAEPYAAACELIERQKAPIAQVRDDIQKITGRDGYSAMVAQVNNQDSNGLQAQALGVLASSEEELARLLDQEDTEISQRCNPSAEAVPPVDTE